VDVLVDGSAVVTQLAYPNTQAGNDGFFEVEVPAGTYDVQVVSSDGGDVLIDLPETTFDLNQSYLVAAVAGADGPTVEVTSSTVPGNSIYDVLVSDSRFSTLVSALLSANLGETLDTGGPFTVFAPTNGAFDAILNSLGMTSADMMTDGLNLGPVLLYHVVDGEVKAEALVTMDSVTTLQGEDITVSTGNFGAVLNGDVNVTRTDLTADNGVIHIVNHVLLPPSLAEVLGMSMGDETMAEEMTEEPMMEATEEPMMEATEEPMEATEEAPMEATEEPPTATEEASS
ncbi:MAG: fasciclin domain-containing protein, partial [Anaerolineae bacterium]|nr:fasciclin domain-containing protein [Anaerolineae bacterium]